MAQAAIVWDAADFLVGFDNARREMKGDGERILHDLGRRVVNNAKGRAAQLKHPDPRYRAGELAESIDMQSGQDGETPWVDVGTDKRYALFVEFGTFKDRPQPFMRPALSLAARAVRFGGGRVSRPQTSVTRAIRRRARKQAVVRRAVRLQQRTAGTLRTRARRRRR